jgi:hypothetical protein
VQVLWGMIFGPFTPKLLQSARRGCNGYQLFQPGHREGFRYSPTMLIEADSKAELSVTKCLPVNMPWKASTRAIIVTVTIDSPGTTRDCRTSERVLGVAHFNSLC